MSSGGVANAGGAGSGGVPNGGASGSSGDGGLSSGGAGMSGGGAGGQSGEGGLSSGGAGMSGGGAGGQSGETAAGGVSGSGGAVGGSGGTNSNLVANGTFDTGATSPWWGHATTSTEYPADQTLAVTDGRLCGTMTAGGKNVWDVIIGLSDLALVQNQYYRITFSVSADADRTIKFKTGLGVTPYTDYFIKSVPITTTPQTVDYTYLNLRNDPTAQFQFQTGGMPGTVCVDDVVIEPVAAPAMPIYATAAPSGRPFKDYVGLVKMGTAVDTPIFLSNPQHNAIVAGEFSAITPANSMKMNLIQPTQGVFDFTDTDALVAWAQLNGLEFRGHPLIWHTQTPSWLTDGTFDRDQMIAIMYAHIDGLMARYAGKFPYWDVVNEAVNEINGAWTFRSTVWHDRIGADFIDLAFARARAADPTAKLLYNDYNIEQMGNAKADHVFNMVSSMKTRGIPIDAIGLQSHYFVEPNGNTASGVPDMQAIRDNMARYHGIGVEVHVTECDFRIGKPLDDNKTALQNKFYADLLQACIDAPNCSHFTVWGLSDLDSWVPGTFADYDHAHLFDTELKPKPGYFAMSQVFAQYNPDDLPMTTGGAGSSAGSSAGASAGAGGSSSASPSSKDKASGGCSFAPRAHGPAPWLLTALAILGVLLSRRRSKERAGA